MLISRESAHARSRWVYLDAGSCNGLPETRDERIYDRIQTPRHGRPYESVFRT